ncbi:MAG: hypothetical protein ACYCX4_18245 [Bacillota bacterium]
MYKNHGPAGCDKPVWIDKYFEMSIVNAITERFSEDKIKELAGDINAQHADEIKDIHEAKRHVEKEMDKNIRETRELIATIKEAGTKSKAILLAELETLAEQKELLESQLA